MIPICLFEDGCKSRFASNPQLFNAQDGLPLGGGIVSDELDNPFANWTKVYLPYCNQDVFIGGGVVESFGEVPLASNAVIEQLCSCCLVRFEVDDEEPVYHSSERL